MSSVFGKNRKQPAARVPLNVEEPDPDWGLSAGQVAERVRLGYDNAPVSSPGKTVQQILISNIFTYFNLIFFILAGFTVAVRSWLNLSFMVVVIVNTVIGIVQELRSKRVIDRLTLLSAPKCTVLREGREFSVDTRYLVRDDLVRFRAGEQICADAVVLQGECRANEALITGEADEIVKGRGDALLSGSFLVSGSCLARLTAVGADS